MYKLALTDLIGFGATARGWVWNTSIKRTLTIYLEKYFLVAQCECFKKYTVMKSMLGLNYRDSPIWLCAVWNTLVYSFMALKIYSLYSFFAFNSCYMVFSLTIKLNVKNTIFVIFLNIILFIVFIIRRKKTNRIQFIWHGVCSNEENFEYDLSLMWFL